VLPAVESGHETINYYVGRDLKKGIILHDTQKYGKVQGSCDEEEMTVPKKKSDEVRWKYDCWK